MKKIITSLMALALPVLMQAQGWPANYGGVMLQSFSWESFNDTRWNNLTNQADELSQYFDLIWLPQSGSCGGTSMGYDPLYFFNQSSSFGTETQLRTLIQKLKANGTGCIADVVLNHHKALTGWLTFPKETYNGKTYQLLSTDVCHNDDGGATLTWAGENGFTLSNNNDTGEDWSGARDLDHKSTNVQNLVNDYLNFLINDIGYVGFRYDMARGFSASYFGQYNASAKPQFSVGEHWTNSTSEIDWMNGTRVNGNIMSGVFDFDFRYTVRNAFNYSNMGSLNQPNGGQNNWPLVSNADQGYLLGGFYRRYAVTFVENHDLQDRGNVENYNADPLKRDTIAANAYMMAMPGTPCVFMPHWKDCKQDIKGQIDVRKAVGITNTSTYNILNQAYNCYAIETNGTGNKKLVTIVGGKTGAYTPSTTQYTLIVDGYHYRYYMSRNCETAWIDKASGYYNKAQNVTMTAVSQSTNAQLVYTTDGTEPSATNGTKVASGYVLRLREPMTLKVGLLVGSTVRGIQTRVYDLPEIEDFTPHTATVYFKDPSSTVATWKDVYYWAYDGTGIINPTKTWPGDPMTETVTIRDEKFYYKSFPIDEEDYTFSIVLNAKGQPQTVDVTGINKDIYLQLGSLNGQNKYTVTNVTRIYERYNPLNQATGDVNGDKKVDVEDVNAIINIILKTKTASNYSGKSDVNDDGKIDVEDVNAVINIILGI